MAKTTADGKTAIRVREHAGNTWLIRTQTQTHLTEIPAGVAIEDYDDSVWPREFYAPARAWRLYHDEIDAEMRRNGVKPGWYVETPSYGNIGPFARRDEAEGYLKRYAAENMGQYFGSSKPEAQTAEPVATAQPEISERHAELRAEWSQLYLVTEYIDKADTIEYHAAVAARTDASQEMVARRMWRSPIGPSSTDPTWETWYEVALEIYDRELAHIASYTVEA